MSEDIITYISTELDVDINESDELLSSGLIDSISIMKLVSFLEESYEVKIPPQDMIIENFNTVESIAQYVSTQIDHK